MGIVGCEALALNVVVEATPTHIILAAKRSERHVMHSVAHCIQEIFQSN